jgi:D-alanyl-D-alanine carboxypeptidase
VRRSTPLIASLATAAIVLAACTSTGTSSPAMSAPSASSAPSATAAVSSAAASPSASAVSIAPLPTAAMAEAEAAKIDAQITDLIASAKGQVPSLIVGIWDPSKGVYVKAFGDGDSATGQQATTDDSFRIGSVTKTFIATLVLQQVAAGAIDLDAKASTYVPDLAQRYPALNDVTVRQLLAMQSGLPDFEKPVLGRVGVDPSSVKKTWTADDVIAAAFASGKATAPGATPAVYTNTNYIVLGKILESVTGSTVGDLVRTTLLTPLGMSTTVYPEVEDTTLPDPHTRGYVDLTGTNELTTAGGKVAPNTDATDWTASWGGAAGIMSSTVTDLATWAQADFGNALLPEDLLKQRLQTNQLNEGGQYGLGLQQYGPWVGHLGGIPGWATFAMKNQDTGTIVVISANSCCGVAPLAELGLVEQIYPGLMSNITLS